MCSIQSTGEQVAHWEESWQWVWLGKKRKICQRQDHHTILLKTSHNLQSIPLCILRAASSQMTPLWEIFLIRDESLLQGYYVGNLEEKISCWTLSTVLPDSHLVYTSLLFFLSPSYSTVCTPAKDLGINRHMDSQINNFFWIQFILTNNISSSQHSKSGFILASQNKTK